MAASNILFIQVCLIAFIFLQLVSAVPQASVCAPLASVISCIDQDADPTSYCRSYLAMTPAVVRKVVATTTASSGSTTVTKYVTKTASVSQLVETVTSISTDAFTETWTVVETEYVTTSTNETATLTCIPVTTTSLNAVVGKRAVTSSSDSSASTSAAAPSCLQTLESTAISSACSCLTIASGTTTSSVTKTVIPHHLVTTHTLTHTITPVVTSTTTISLEIAADYLESLSATTTLTTTLGPSPSIIPAGLTYYQYASPYNTTSLSNLSEIDPTTFQSATYTSSGTVEDLSTFLSTTANFSGESTQTCWPAWSDVEINCPNTAFVIQAYLYISPGSNTTSSKRDLTAAGTYSLTLSTASNTTLLYLWTADAALGTWTNSDLAASSSSSLSSTNSVSLGDLEAGSLTAVTLLWIDLATGDEGTGTGAGIGMSVIEPGGETVEDTTRMFVGGCDGGNFDV